jgi:hypothetical protein
MPRPVALSGKPKPPPTLRQSNAGFQDAIEKAVLAGAKPEDMTLHLTHRDASNLRRDPAIPLEAISFSDGEMRLMGVRVITGGIATSALQVEKA